MGTWGSGLYSNDIAEDVRDMCNEIFPFVDIKEGNKILFTEFSEIVNLSITDNDSASFWYALADWQWKKEVNRMCKYLKWVGYALLFVTLVGILGTAYRTGASMNRAIVDCIAETIVSFVVQGAGDLFNRIARFIPYFGFLIGLIGGWLLSYALSKLFNSKKVRRVKNKFANSIRNVRTGLWNWLKAGMASLTA